MTTQTTADRLTEAEQLIVAKACMFRAVADTLATGAEREQLLALSRRIGAAETITLTTSK